MPADLELPAEALPSLTRAERTKTIFFNYRTILKHAFSWIIKNFTRALVSQRWSCSQTIRAASVGASAQFIWPFAEWNAKSKAKSALKQRLILPIPYGPFPSSIYNIKMNISLIKSKSLLRDKKRSEKNKLSFLFIVRPSSINKQFFLPKFNAKINGLLADPTFRFLQCHVFKRPRLRKDNKQYSMNGNKLNKNEKFLLKSVKFFSCLNHWVTFHGRSLRVLLMVHNFSRIVLFSSFMHYRFMFRSRPP